MGSIFIARFASQQQYHSKHNLSFSLFVFIEVGFLQLDDLVQLKET